MACTQNTTEELILHRKCLGSLFHTAKTEEGGERGTLPVRREPGVLQGSKDRRRREDNLKIKKGPGKMTQWVRVLTLQA